MKFTKLFFSFLVSCVGSLHTASAQTWKQKADVGGPERDGAVGFSIGTKGYIGTGVIDFGSLAKDFWEYDPATNAWTQKADVGVLGRWGAVGFSIGTKGYIGTGNDDNGYLNDFWEYDPATDAWTLKADFGGPARAFAAGFSIGTKGYIGTGNGIDMFFDEIYFTDFWEYDPATDAWTQKANFGDQARWGAVGFSIGTKGYIGTGRITSNFFLSAFSEYDPATDAWTIKADFGGPGRNLAVGFSIGTKGYIGTGIRRLNGFNDFWEFGDDCLTPTAYAVTGGGGYCLGGLGVAVGLANSETGVTYQLMNGATLVGSPVSGTTGSALTFGNQTAAATYTVVATRTTDGCTATMTGSAVVTVTPGNTAGAASSMPTLCINTGLIPITHTTTGATGIGMATGLPAGVTAGFSGNTITISGTPSVGGTFIYSIPLTGGCGSATAAGKITVDICWYWDRDGDGFGRNNNIRVSLSQPPGYVAVGGDCNDNNAAIHPDATEICDGIDNNCNGTIDEGLTPNVWYFDRDGDGFGRSNKIKTQCGKPDRYVAVGGDCNDNNAAIHPDATEICDGIDNNCNGTIDEGLTPNVWYFDRDGDGFGRSNKIKTQCGKPDRYVAVGGDCNDNNAAINPGAAEICDGKDNDCDGAKDEDCLMITSVAPKQAEMVMKGNEPQSKELSFEVWPNPATSFIQVSLTEMVIGQKAEVTLLKADGKVASTHSLIPYQKGEMVRMDSRTLGAGLYFVRLSQGNMIKVKQVMIIR